MRGGTRRLVFIGVGAMSAVLGIAALSLLFVFLEVRGGGLATLLLDFQNADTQFFPYPLTIQNIMHVCWFAGFADLFYRWTEARSERRALRRSTLPTDDRTVLVPADLQSVRDHARGVDATAFLSRLVDQCVQHFQTHRAVADAHQLLASMVSLELNRLELRYSLARYLVWLLPTIGFIGTVTGISLALDTAGSVGEPDMSLITGQLAIAFFTTLVALCQSAVLVFVLHIVQQLEEGALTDAADHCLRNLINRLYLPDQGSPRASVAP